MAKKKLTGQILKGKRTAAVRIAFSIPTELASVLESSDLNRDQKILLVKSYTEEIKGDKGNLLKQIPNQHGVILIMALELGAL